MTEGETDRATPALAAPAGESADGNGKQERLLRAAAAIIAAEGTQGLSIRRLAAEVGASTMAVYTWYGNKPNLLRAVFREAFTRFGAQLRAVPETDDPLLDLLRLGRAYRDYALAEPNLYEVMFGRSLSLFEPTEDDLAMAADTFGVLLNCVRRGVQSGALSCRPVDGAWQIWAGVHGAMTLELLNSAPPEELAGEPITDNGSSAAARTSGLTRTLLVGLGADPQRVDGAMAAVG